MSFQIDTYCQSMLAALQRAFQQRLCYVGLQGSYLRGEATEHSDIDLVVILDTLQPADLVRYRELLEAAGEFHRSCGFICSREDLQHWNPLEGCQLLHSTKDLYGTLADLLPAWTEADEVNYIKLSLNNLYHALCHSYVHGDRSKLRASLPNYYKAAYFILQNTQYLESFRRDRARARFILPKAELLEQLTGADHAVLDTAIRLGQGEDIPFEQLYEQLLCWCQQKQNHMV